MPMNRAERRHPPRPQVIPEQLRQQYNGVPHVLNRDQSMQMAVMLGANLERILNDDTRMPWITASIDKRSDGFSLHVQVVEPTMDTDADII